MKQNVSSGPESPCGVCGTYGHFTHNHERETPKPHSTPLRSRTQEITAEYWEVRDEQSERVAVAQLILQFARLQEQLEAAQTALREIAKQDVPINDLVVLWQREKAWLGLESNPASEPEEDA